ncbi:hypothetical protein [uncultured Pseudacidovorax sp.]|uniref:hypothetical protein n=1 Tax=uncultured Pseudacidovorax sp. TaxID=679313 RepID=UPI0025E4ADDE|nr:hypothetical protein [uncultured Pseudacidovorax sp.]
MIAIWGAWAADRRALTDALAQRFHERGLLATTLPNTEAASCSRSASGPDPDEALGRSHDWRMRIDEASRSALVVTDRSPVALLAEADLEFQRWPAALIAAEQRHAFTLLLPPPDPPSPEAQALDSRLRAAFAAVGLPCAIIHGREPEQRLARAWAALQSGLDGRDERLPPAQSQPRLRSSAWNCERCSDPDCEHRLFTDLLARRQRPVTG